jgi:hypothetical protein
MHTLLFFGIVLEMKLGSWILHRENLLVVGEEGVVDVRGGKEKRKGKRTVGELENWEAEGEIVWAVQTVRAVEGGRAARVFVMAVEKSVLREDSQKNWGVSLNSPSMHVERNSVLSRKPLKVSPTKHQSTLTGRASKSLKAASRSAKQSSISFKSVSGSKDTLITESSITRLFSFTTSSTTVFSSRTITLPLHC